MSNKERLSDELENFAREKLSDEKKEYDMPTMSEEGLANMKKAMEEAKKDKANEKNGKVVPLHRARNIGIAAAVALVMAVLLILPNTSATVAHAMSDVPVLGKLVQVVTFRDYSYEDERNKADVHVGELDVNDNADASAEAKENAKKSTAEINAEVEKISDQFIKEFKENLSEEGYQDVIVKSEVVNTTDDYFTLKLITYIGSGSGAEWNNYYTIDMNTGERLALADLFVDGADYKTPINKSIKSQMKKQMAEDENVTYWLDSDVDEWNFKSIDDDTQFYINEKGNLVISFDEGDVAPMYMGVVTFEIPNSAIADIRK